ncbi:MAG TPA: hypothetical protein ENK44_01485 [Caldithrix abyssi]|uniref:Uncharacterized protein n=1 Tax=Caldithrix abyssi TaxID=187145 RepID=A0A7V4WTP1_CALAY|nr:hypothetical protein [Caldithrix abyssi]
MFKFRIITAILCLFSVQSIFAQHENFDEQDFFRKLHDSYYTLENSGFENMTAFVSSLKFEKFAKNIWKNTEIFPLQFMWFRPNKMYISERGVPSFDKKKESEYRELVDGIKQQLRGILVDLSRYYITGIYTSILDNYVLRHNEQAVQITYETGKDWDLTKVKNLFGYNGLLLETQIIYPAQKKIILIYPSFRLVKTKWLIDNWQVQTTINGEVVNGFEIRLENAQVNNVWVPVNIIIKVKKADEPENTYYDMLKLRNIIFNQSLELVPTKD